jgi:hypothetical protein
VLATPAGERETLPSLRASQELLELEVEELELFL